MWVNGYIFVASFNSILVCLPYFGMRELCSILMTLIVTDRSLVFYNNAPNFHIVHMEIMKMIMIVLQLTDNFHKGNFIVIAVCCRN